MGTAGPAGQERCLHGLKPTAASSRVLRTCLYHTPAGPPTGAVRGARVPAPSAPSFPRAQSDDPGLPHHPGTTQATPARSHSRLRGPGSTLLGDRLPREWQLVQTSSRCGPRPHFSPHLRPAPRRGDPALPAVGRGCLGWSEGSRSDEKGSGSQRAGQGRGPGLSDVSQQLVLTPDRRGSRLGAHTAAAPPRGSRRRQNTGAADSGSPQIPVRLHAAVRRKDFWGR